MGSDETIIVAEINPFASPLADASVSVAQSGYRVRGNKLEARTPIQLPHVCIHCGDDADQGRRFDRTIYWTPPWIFLLLLAGPIFVVIGSMLVRKPMKIDYALCPDCNGRRKTRIAVVALIWLALLGCGIMALAWESGAMGLVCLPLFIAGIIGLILCGEHFKATSHRDGVFQLAGAKAPFLEHPIVQQKSLEGEDLH